MIVAVDLAARFSAVVVLDSGGEVIDQFDSSGRSTINFLDEIVSWMTYSQSPVKLIIEDVPYGISNQKMIKSVLRLQGLLHGLLVCELEPERLENIFYVLPSTWQRCFEGVWKGGEQGAAAAALKLGYEPPDLVAERGPDMLNAKGKLLAKDRHMLEKVMTDYVDAYLIAIWALAAGDDITGVTQPFFI